jgi:hypothetical protein
MSVYHANHNDYDIISLPKPRKPRTLVDDDDKNETLIED